MLIPSENFLIFFDYLIMTLGKKIYLVETPLIFNIKSDKYISSKYVYSQH